MEQDNNGVSLLTLRLHDLARPVLQVDSATSIRETAEAMTSANNNAALIIDGGKLSGIVTDQNFRVRVVAAGFDPDEPVASIMTREPLTLPHTAAASEAFLLMASRNIRHIPIVDPHTQAIHGVVSATDLLRSQSYNAVYLIGDIHLAKDAPALQRLSQHIPQALVSMVRSELTAYHVAHALSSIGHAITRRLLQLGEQQFGAPPVAYVFLVAGSMARSEQTAYSDQDNGLLLADDYDETLHGDYFVQLAQFVSDGLDACGYRYCSGNIMATNPQWRQPLAVWRNYFSDWINSPSPQALLNASIFFDLRCLSGDETLFTQLQHGILQQTRSNRLFQSYLAANAMSFRPPLGFFKGFVLEEGAAGSKGLDMKKRGVVPIIDLIRVYTLALGLPEQNTRERMAALQQQTTDVGISAGSLADLQDAFEFISNLRLQHQARQIEAGIAPDHYVPPEQFSALEQRYLKNAFEVVSDLQSALARQYQADNFR